MDKPIFCEDQVNIVMCPLDLLASFSQYINNYSINYILKYNDDDLIGNYLVSLCMLS